MYSTPASTAPLFLMLAHAVAAAAQTRGDDVHDYLHDVHEPEPTFASSHSSHGARGMARVLRRSTTSTSDIVHDKYFIPGVVAAGVVLGVVLLCVIFLLRKKAKPPGVHWATPQNRLSTDMRQQPRASMSTPGHNGTNNVGLGPPGSPDGSRRLSNIQRKPIPDLPYGAESSAPPLDAPLYDVSGPYGAQGAYGTNQSYQNQPGTLYRPQQQTVAFDSLPQAQDHHTQFQNQYPPYDAQQHTYQQQNPGASRNIAVSPPANAAAPGGQWQQNQQNYPGTAPTRESMLSGTDQSATQVGSDKDYYPGGYGKMGMPTQKQAQGGAGSPGHEEEYFDPYGGIERGNTAGSRSQVRR